MILSWGFHFFGALENPSFKPKYGPLETPRASPLSQDSTYLQTSGRASDFWILIPYYVGQRDDNSCALASIATLTNALRSRFKLSSEDELISQDKIAESLPSEFKSRFSSKDNPGIFLAEMPALLNSILPKFGIQKFSVSINPENIEEVLEKSEKNPDDFILVNFLQSAYTDDAATGHWGLVGAYDSRKKRLLILDPDRKFYEPYWVSYEDFLKGIEAVDSQTGKKRGIIYFQR